MARLPTPVFLGFPCSSAGKEFSYNAGDLGSIPGEGKGYPLQYSGLENSMTVHGVAKSQTRLSNFYYTTLGVSLPSYRLELKKIIKEKVRRREDF